MTREAEDPALWEHRYERIKELLRDYEHTARAAEDWVHDWKARQRLGRTLTDDELRAYYAKPAQDAAE